MKPMMFSKSAEPKPASKRPERAWIKKDGRLQSYWFVADEPLVTAYAIVMASS